MGQDNFRYILDGETMSKDLNQSRSKWELPQSLTQSDSLLKWSKMYVLLALIKTSISGSLRKLHISRLEIEVRIRRRSCSVFNSPITRFLHRSIRSPFTQPRAWYSAKWSWTSSVNWDMVMTIPFHVYQCILRDRRESRVFYSTVELFAHPPRFWVVSKF